MPSRFLLEIPDELMHGPRLVVQDEDDDQRPDDERGGFLDSILSRPDAWRAGVRWPGGGRVGRAATAAAGRRPRAATGCAPAGRDVPAVARPGRQAGGVLRHGARRGRRPMPPSRGPWPARAVIPGERRYRDGDRVRHARFGEGTVVSSKLTRDDEEVTVAFPDPTVGIKRLLASLANLEIVG